MKKLITATIMFILLCCNTLHAQFYMMDPNYGYKLGVGTACINYARHFIAIGKYSKAIEMLEKACDEADFGPAYSLLGKCYELGIGVERDLEIADEYYEYGAQKLNSIDCMCDIQRINNNGHWLSSHRKQFLAEMKQRYSADPYGIPSGGGGGYVGGSTINNNNSSSSSTYSTCRICGGSGTCTSCHGQGGSWQDTGYYTGSGNKSWINCPSCNGSKRCFNCHGTGRQ